MAKASKGIAGLKSVLTDIKSAVNKGIEKASGARKAKLEKEFDLYDKMYKNANRFGGRETMRRKAVGKSSGLEMKGATRVTESTGDVTAMVGKKRIREFAKDVIDGQMADRQAAIKKGLLAVSGAGLGGYVIGAALSDDKSKGAKASTKSKAKKKPPLPRSKPKRKTPPLPKNKPPLRTRVGMKKK
jgi:hypothetical protein|tara:strand:- start:19 stop:576 length:558 start_codon:yes stop_codon:yes gene_type:complete